MESLINNVENNCKLYINYNIPSVFHPRLAWMIYYQQVHSIKKVCDKFGISRKTFYKWWERYCRSGYDPGSLFDKSKKPHNSPLATPLHIVQKIVDAKINTNYGVRKLRLYLMEKYNIRISEHTIWKILKKHYNTCIAPKIEPTKSLLPGDEVFITIYNSSIYSQAPDSFVFNSIDTFTRLRVSKIFSHVSESNILEFLKYTIQSYPFEIKKIKIIDVEYFDILSKAIDNFRIEKISKANKYEKDMILTEIYNVDKEFFIKNIDYKTIFEINRKFDQHLLDYNNNQQNESLNGLTPLQKLKTINHFKNIIIYDYRQ